MHALRRQLAGFAIAIGATLGGGDGVARAVSVPRECTRPGVAKYVQPKYPPAALRAGMQGESLLRVLVAADGSASVVELVRSSGHAELDEAALAALKHWRFTAGDCVADGGGQWLLVPMSFRNEKPTPQPTIVREAPDAPNLALVDHIALLRREQRLLSDDPATGTTVFTNAAGDERWFVAHEPHERWNSLFHVRTVAVYDTVTHYVSQLCVGAPAWCAAQEQERMKALRGEPSHATPVSPSHAGSPGSD